ncbi:MAG: guanylate kinase [Prevotellaceae bacterium]|jgi:guanylate kinase|nr:guanylate kinase [Prevotellaceae bacterium]
MGKVIIFSAPSGSGKTTIVRHLLKVMPELEFSISATSRAPRGTEVDGKDYYFLATDEFRSRIKADDFVEWEEVYHGKYYGTLKSEPERIWASGKHVLFDVDVHGGISLKKIFGDKALLIFIMPPSVEELRNRLIARSTDAPEVIDERVAKAELELSFSKHFDRVIINDRLDEATVEAERAIKDFIAGRD